MQHTNAPLVDENRRLPSQDSPCNVHELAISISKAEQFKNQMHEEFAHQQGVHESFAHQLVKRQNLDSNTEPETRRVEQLRGQMDQNPTQRDAEQEKLVAEAYNETVKMSKFDSSREKGNLTQQLKVQKAKLQSELNREIVAHESTKRRTLMLEDHVKLLQRRVEDMTVVLRGEMSECEYNPQPALGFLEDDKTAIADSQQVDIQALTPSDLSKLHHLVEWIRLGRLHVRLGPGEAARHC